MFSELLQKQIQKWPKEAIHFFFYAHKRLT